MIPHAGSTSRLRSGFCVVRDKKRRIRGVVGTDFIAAEIVTYDGPAGAPGREQP